MSEPVEPLSENTVFSIWRLVLKPQVLIALVLCCFMAYRVLVNRTTLTPELTKIDFTESPEEILSTQSFELLIYDEQHLERPLIKELSVGNSRPERARAILSALQTELDVWPENLRLSTVFNVPINGVSTTLIDFVLEPDESSLSLNDEWRLLESISASLKRNDMGVWRILINHEESSSFLRYIDLEAF